jgi:hypothetical protein
MKIIKIHDLGFQMAREDAQELAETLARYPHLTREPIIEKFLECLEEGLKGEVPF